MQSFEHQNNYKNNRGFTLIEILIATAILAFSSLLIYNVVTGSFDINKKLTAESDTLLALNIAMQALERDISQQYSPRISDARIPETNNPSIFWSALIRPDGFRRMRFQGGKEKISFITNSNRKLQTDEIEPELIKVVWQIVSEKDGTYSLVRSTDLNTFDYEDAESNNKNLKKFRVLEKLQGGSFFFYRGDKEKWEENWDSEAAYTTDDSRYPTLIAIELSYSNPEKPDVPVKWRSEFTSILSLNGVTQSTSTVSGAPAGGNP